MRSYAAGTIACSTASAAAICKYRRQVCLCREPLLEELETWTSCPNSERLRDERARLELIHLRIFALQHNLRVFTAGVLFSFRPDKWQRGGVKRPSGSLAGSRSNIDQRKEVRDCTDSARTARCRRQGQVSGGRSTGYVPAAHRKYTHGTFARQSSPMSRADISPPLRSPLQWTPCQQWWQGGCPLPRVCTLTSLLLCLHMPLAASTAVSHAHLSTYSWVFEPGCIRLLLSSPSGGHSSGPLNHSSPQ